MPAFEVFPVRGARRVIRAPNALAAYKIWAGMPENSEAVLDRVYCSSLRRIVAIDPFELREQDKGYCQPPRHPWQALVKWARDAVEFHGVPDPDGIVSDAVSLVADRLGDRRY